MALIHPDDNIRAQLQGASTMFLGHYAASFAAKRLAPGVSLGTLVAASLLLDLLWPVFLLTGAERVRFAPAETPFLVPEFVSYPWSHSLMAVLLWAVGFASLHLLGRRRLGAAIVLGALVVSHWVLDVLTHRPDLPLTPSETTKVGLGLWTSVPLTLALELLLFAGGIWVYLRSTRATDRIGSVAYWLTISLLLLLYFGTAFGPPPPSVGVVAWSALSLVLLIPLFAWIDRHRQSRTAGEE